MVKENIIFLAIGGVAMASVVGIYAYKCHKDTKIAEQKVENERLYFEKLTPEQVESLEREKLEVKKAEIELKHTEAEMKKTVVDFKNDIQKEVETKAMNKIHDDMRDTFDSWSAKFETRLENKIDNVVTRIDNLSDKYGGVKAGTNSAPTISVVNAPNN